MTNPRPSSKLYGVTHDLSGTPRVVEPKTVKVGIGLAKGKAIHVYIDLEKRWVIALGSGQEIQRERFEEKERAQMRYRELQRSAPNRRYPEKIPYFTFSHLSASGDFEPDWDVIESHGPVPTEIDIIFVWDDPFAASYQFWGTAEKKCDGDGKVALRVVGMASTPAEQALAAEAEKRGERYFPVTTCWLDGCQYSRSTPDGPAPCRPMGRLLFQLLNSPRLGGTAVFNTAGYKSISQIFSSIEIFKRATGGGNPERGFVAGIPLKMVLRPYRVTYDGRTATQYAVSLEFRAESALALKRSLVEQAVQYRIAGTEPLRQLEGMELSELPPVHEELEENPAAIAAEFDPAPAAEPAGPAESDEDDPDNSLAGGPLEHAWNDDMAQAGSAGSARIKPEEARKLYDLCRARGMTDAMLAEELGRYGFETLNEITAKELPHLTAWAAGWQPAGHRSLF